MQVWHDFRVLANLCVFVDKVFGYIIGLKFLSLKSKSILIFVEKSVKNLTLSWPDYMSDFLLGEKK